jgi:parallel beta-helix repeat protein
VQVSACQKIDKPGTYVVTKDLLSPEVCFPVTASSVTIDLGGHTIGGNGSRDGIESQPPPATVLSDITVKNGTLQHFSDAIDLSESNNPVIDGVKAIENGRNGILVTGTNATVRNSTADKNLSVGIRAGNFATLEGNTATNNEYGLWASCPGTLTNNKTHGNSSMDIYLVNDAKRCTMTGNTGDKVSK